MYKSRYHFSNDFISFAIDSLSGDILEMVNLANGENYLKNACYELPQPFALKLTDNKVLFPPSSRQVAHDNSLKCDINGGSDGLTVKYHSLTDGKEFYKAEVSYSIRFEDNKSVWNLEIADMCGSGTLCEAKFPCLNGIWLGEDWSDDILIFPVNAGAKYVNPTEYFEKPRKTIQWRWQEYRYVYPVDGCCGYKSQDGTYQLRHNYPGDASMSWLDYYDKNGGIYFASHDTEPRLTAIIASTYGSERPGMHFAIANELHLESGESWRSPDRVVALHKGDWHDGADIYAEYKTPLLTKCAHPEWFDRSPGLIAHYDFKYQNKQIVHRYEDIPTLRSEAREVYGVDHILLSGWHKNGFDNGFPLYYADEEMGDESRLAEGIKPEDDMHVSLYVNAWLCNTAYADIEADVARKVNGESHLCKFGDDALTFGLMCPGSDGWSSRMTGIANHVENDWGGGIYFDMLSAHPRSCYSEEHSHSYDMICNEVKKMLTKLADGKFCMMGEHVTDEYGGIISGQLMQSFFKILTGTYEEVYRYTFPDHILIDMLYPGTNLAMRPVFVAQKSDWLMHNHFVNGIYYWIYDLVDDNTFMRDPKGLKKLRSMIELRRFWLDKFGHGTFRDTKQLAEIPDNCMVRSFKLEDGWIIACANSSGMKLDVKFEAPCCLEKGRVYTAENIPDGMPAVSNGSYITVPESEFSIIHFPLNG